LPRSWLQRRRNMTIRRRTMLLEVIKREEPWG
jgi:hypothetical protein